MPNAPYRTITPFLCQDNPDALIDFLIKGLNAVTIRHVRLANGITLHAQLTIGDSVLMIGCSMGRPAVTGMLYINTPDPDALFAQALTAGAHIVMPVEDQPWGDRAGAVHDDFGNAYWLGRHDEDVPDAEIARRMEGKIGA